MNGDYILALLFAVAGILSVVAGEVSRREKPGASIALREEQLRWLSRSYPDIEQIIDIYKWLDEMTDPAETLKEKRERISNITCLYLYALSCFSVTLGILIRCMPLALVGFVGFFGGSLILSACISGLYYLKQWQKP